MSDAVRTAFRVQADWCRRLDAPFTAAVCDVLADGIDRTTAVGRRVLDWTGDPTVDALALRLAGGLNALVRSSSRPALAAVYPPNPAPAEGLAEAVAAALADDRLLAWLDSAPQTNEVARSGVLMPGLLVIAAATRLPLALHEIGASAGFNLRPDRYSYRLGTLEAGPGDARVRLVPDWNGPPPPAAEVRVTARRGVDLHPVDLRQPAARERLLAFVWPEQTERVQRLEAAAAAFVADPVPLERADAADWVETLALTAGVATVVFHSMAWHYFAPATATRIAAHLAGLGARATRSEPLAWLRFEFDTMDAVPTLRLKLWPGGEDRLLARAGPHGAKVEWLG